MPDASTSIEELRLEYEMANKEFNDYKEKHKGLEDIYGNLANYYSQLAKEHVEIGKARMDIKEATIRFEQLMQNDDGSEFTKSLLDQYEITLRLSIENEKKLASNYQLIREHISEINSNPDIIEYKRLMNKAADAMAKHIEADWSPKNSDKIVYKAAVENEDKKEKKYDRSLVAANLLSAVKQFEDAFCKERGYESREIKIGVEFVAKNGGIIRSTSDKIEAFLPKEISDREKIINDSIDLYLKSIEGKKVISHQMDCKNPVLSKCRSSIGDDFS